MQQSSFFLSLLVASVLGGLIVSLVNYASIKAHRTIAGHDPPVTADAFRASVEEESLKAASSPSSSSAPTSGQASVVDSKFLPHLKNHTSRRYLVFSSVGDNTEFYSHWVGPPHQQSYDIWICYYGANVSQYNVYMAFTDLIERREGSKFQNFVHIYNKYKSRVLEYERVLVMDDDIIISSFDIDRLFSISHSFDLWISQPSFSKNSKTSHDITKYHDNTFLRYTNFVEVNVPLFSRDALRRCMDVLDESLIGWGIDYLCIWMNGKEEESRYAIIDAVQCENPKIKRNNNGSRELRKIKGSNNLFNRWRDFATPRKIPMSWDKKTYGDVKVQNLRGNTFPSSVDTKVKDSMQSKEKQKAAIESTKPNSLPITSQLPTDIITYRPTKVVLKDGNVLFQDIFLTPKNIIVFVATPVFHVTNGTFSFDALNDALSAQLSDPPTTTHPYSSCKIELHFVDFNHESIFYGYIYLPSSTIDKMSVNVRIKFLDELHDVVVTREKIPRAEMIQFTVIKDFDTRLLRWYIEYYRSLGVDLFVLYINGPIDRMVASLQQKQSDFRDILPFIRIHEWDYPYWMFSRPMNYTIHNSQTTALMSFFHRYRHYSKWNTFFDVDEYLVMQEGLSLKEYLSRQPYGKVNSVIFQHCFASLEEPYTSLQSYEEFLQSSMVRDEKLHPGSPGGYYRTKYAVNSNLASHISIHHVGFSNSDKSHIKKPKNKKNTFKTVHSTMRFMHFSFEHGNRSRERMAAVSNTTTLSNLRKNAVVTS